MNIINITKETKMRKKSDVLMYFKDIIDFLKKKGAKPMLATCHGKSWICREPDQADIDLINEYRNKNFNYMRKTDNVLICEKPANVKLEVI